MQFFLFSLFCSIVLGPLLWQEPVLKLALRCFSIATLSAVSFLAMTWAYGKAQSSKDS